MTLSVIIVSYNVKHYTEQCLRSLLVAAKEIPTEIFVVDNCSSDGTVAHLRERFPTLHLINNKENAGFGRANNQALAQATGEYVLFLNPDTILTETTLTDCLAFAREHPDLGGLGVRMLKPDGQFALESRRGLPTPLSAFGKMSGLSALFPRSRRLGRYYMRYLDEHKVNPIEVISGAFFFAPRQALKETGGFDEAFFMYGEDIDLSYRLLKTGRQNYYLPAPILHYKGESTEKSSFRYVHVFYEAMLIFVRKHYRASRFWFTFPLQMAIYMHSLWALARRQFVRLSEHDVHLTEHLLVVGRAEMLSEVRAICARNRLKATFVEGDCNTLPQGHLSYDTTPFQLVVYDVDAYPMAVILRLLETSSQTRGCRLGTYARRTRTLITPHQIFTHEE